MVATATSLDHKLSEWNNPYVTSTEDLRFTPRLLTKPFPRGLAVGTSLQRFVIVTYWVDQSSLRHLIHSQFEPVCLAANGRSQRALVSVVTFLDRDFRFAACPTSRPALAKQTIAHTCKTPKRVNRQRGSLEPAWTRCQSLFRAIYGGCRGIARGWNSTAGTIKRRRGTRRSTSELSPTGRQHGLRSKTQGKHLWSWLASPSWRRDWYCYPIPCVYISSIG